MVKIGEDLKEENNGKYEDLYTSMSIRVPSSFRNRFEKTQDFWKELGSFFVKLVEPLDPNQLEEIKIKYPNIIKFIEEMLPNA